MKLYCLVQNNTVVNGPVALPPNLVDKSDFELLDLGWYYADCVRPDSFVDRYEIMLPVQFDIRTTKVICTFIKRNKTQEELDAQNVIKQQEVEIDKSNRLAIANEFMQSEAYQTLSDTLKNKWVTYVQTVTDTVTSGLGDAIWDVNFPSVPPTSDTPITPPTPVGGENV